MKLSSDIYIHFSLEKEVANIEILKKHAETLHSTLNSLMPKFVASMFNNLLRYFT